MKISELIIAAAVAAFTIPATLHATTDEGGAGSTSGVESSESGYTVQESSPIHGELPGESSEEQGGAGSTSGESSEGMSEETQVDPAASPSPVTDDTGGAGTTSGTSDLGASGSSSESESSDMGGAGTTTGAAGAASGSTLASQIKGVIDSVDASRRSVTIRDSQGNLTSYKLEQGGEVKVGERSASLAALTNGEPVTITVSDSDPTAAKQIKVGSGS